MINLNHYKKGKHKLSYSSYSTIFKKGDSSGEKTWFLRVTLLIELTQKP